MFLLTTLAKLVHRRFRSELHLQIEQYCAWKSLRYPVIADTHRGVLISFMRWSKLKCATTLQYEHVAGYVDSMNSQHYKNQAHSVLKQFCRYWYKMGLLTEQYGKVMKSDLIADMEDLVNPRIDVEKVKRVQKLRAVLDKTGKPKNSFRSIALIMESEDGRKYDVRQIHRWAKYRLPTA